MLFLFCPTRRQLQATAATHVKTFLLIPLLHPLAEFKNGIYGEGQAVLRALEQLRGGLVVGTPQELRHEHGASEARPPEAAGAADLSVKRFSRRRLLQTGGIATRVWTASVLLARWMARHVQAMQGLAQCNHVNYAKAIDCDRRLCGSGGGRVLELGCGLGVGGIAAAMCGCSVLMTDIHDVALSSCQAAIRINAERLRRTASVREFVDGGHLASIDDFLKASEGCSSSGSGRAYTMELDWNNLPDLLPHQRFTCIVAADVVHEDQHAPLISKVIRVCAQEYVWQAAFSLVSHSAHACTLWNLSGGECRCAQPLRHGRISPST